MSTASVSRRADVLRWRAEVREVVGHAEARRQQAGDKHLTHLERQAETGQTRINCYLGHEKTAVHQTNLIESYPGDSGVENQTATGLQDQHGVYILRSKDLLLMFCHKGLQFLSL